MRWLVTGGAGFIGSHFMDHVRGYESSAMITCYDLFTYAANRAWTSSADNVIVGDICDRDTLKEAFQRHEPDIIVNFAAESHVDNSYVQSPAFTRTNVDGVVVPPRNRPRCLAFRPFRPDLNRRGVRGRPLPP